MKEKQPQQLVPTTIRPPILRRNNSLSSLLTSENRQQSNSLKNQSKNNGQNFKNYDSSSICDAGSTSTSHPIIRRNSSSYFQFADELTASRTNKGHNKQFSLNQQYNIPSDMVYFKIYSLPFLKLFLNYENTTRGKEIKFGNQKKEILVVEPCVCKTQNCLLYEYLNKSIAKNEHSHKSNSKKFRWISEPRSSKSDSDVNKIEVLFSFIFNSF
ncbi:unnamed protein product [Meloidogyne enterolobii]|uniref:Uncharacterized protein n=1 Tax=Meloidogyne enterolobii TaxID=390850 RepID=A0ACB0YB83_MELEN